MQINRVFLRVFALERYPQELKQDCSYVVMKIVSYSNHSLDES